MPANQMRPTSQWNKKRRSGMVGAKVVFEAWRIRPPPFSVGKGITIGILG